MEIVNVTGISQWFNSPIDGTTRAALDAAARAPANQTLYRWRTDAINIYINGRVDQPSGGIASFPAEGEVVLFASSTCNPCFELLLHELGHYFDLLHTHEGSTCPNNGGDDQVEDTLPTVNSSTPGPPPMSCVSTLNNLAALIPPTGRTYTQLSALEKLRVDSTFDNNMGYTGTGKILTQSQLDKAMSISNKATTDNGRFHVATGTTRFVPLLTGTHQYGTPSYSNVLQAVTAATSGDIILVRAGIYAENITISPPPGFTLTLRASRGNAVIGTGALQPVAPANGTLSGEKK